MSLLKIVTYPDPVLLNESQEINNIDGNLVELAKNMKETMYAAPGIGLAAPQVGVPLRLITVDIDSQNKKGLITLINPQIIEQEGSQTLEEGCLSLPSVVEEIKRYKKILVSAIDLNGNPIQIEADGLLSVVLQHEIDHLNGILLLDYLSLLKKKFYKKKLIKQQNKKY